MRMIKTNQDAIGEHWIRNDNMLTVGDEEKKIARKSYQEMLLNTEFAMEKNSYSQWYTVTAVPCLIDKVMVSKESKERLHNHPEREKEAKEAGVDRITDLINQFLVHQ